MTGSRCWLGKLTHWSPNFIWPLLSPYTVLNPILLTCFIGIANKLDFVYITARIFFSDYNEKWGTISLIKQLEALMKICCITKLNFELQMMIKIVCISILILFAMFMGIYLTVNSLALGDLNETFIKMFYKLILVVDGWGISCTVAFGWLSLWFR